MTLHQDVPVLKLKREELYSLEKYAEVRNQFRAKVIEHKKNRNVAVGPNARLYFEDKLTIQYQVQEMLRVERIFEAAGIEEELHAYNPLIPDGSNWKATFMLEYDDIEERRVALGRLIGVEDRVWVCVASHPKVFAIADEDLERANETKTSSVHFVRFELTPSMIADAKKGAAIRIGIDHPHYRHEVTVADGVRTSLAGDLT